MSLIVKQKIAKQVIKKESVENEGINSILDSIINELGNAKGRRLLAMYASTGNIEHIPAEFRAQIENISTSEINNYLNPLQEAQKQLPSVPKFRYLPHLPSS